MLATLGRSLLCLGAVVLIGVGAGCSGENDGGDTGQGSGGATTGPCSQEDGCKACDSCLSICLCTLGKQDACEEACSTSGGGNGGGGGSGGGGGGSGGSGGSSGNGGSSSGGDGGSGNASGSGGGGSGGTDPGDPFAAARQECVDRINAFRATLGLPPYERWTAQEGCSDSQAQADAASMNAHGNFGMCTENAQNTCPGYPSLSSVTGQCLDQMWAEGPPPTTPCTGQCFQDHGHYLNMSSTKFTRVACGFANMSNGRVWANQNFK